MKQIFIFYFLIMFFFFSFRHFKASIASKMLPTEKLLNFLGFGICLHIAHLMWNEMRTEEI